MSDAHPDVLSVITAFLRERQASIVDAWQHGVRELPSARRLPQPLLIDHVPDLLLEIGAVAGAVSGPGDADVSMTAAQRHAVSRLDASFDLTEVIAEYAVLRDCMLGAWEHTVPEPARRAGRRMLDRAIDTVLIGTVERYTQARDRLLDTLDRVSTAAFEAASLDQLLGTLAAVLLDAIEAVDTVTILLRQDEELVVRASVGLEQEVREGVRIAIGEGFAGRIAAENRPMLLRSAANAVVASEVLGDSGIQAVYGVPLVDGGRVMGVVHMGSRTASDFSDQDKRMLGALGHRATAALVQHLLREQAQARASQQAAIAGLSQSALSSRELHELLQQAVTVVSRTLETDISQVLELCPDGRTFELRAAYGPGQGRGEPTPIPAGSGSQAGFTILTREPVIVDDLAAERRFRVQPVLQEHGVASGMTVVIDAAGYGDRPYGVFGTHSLRPRAFTSGDLTFLQAVANVVASAISNDAAKRREAFLSAATRTLAESIDYEATLQRVARVAVPDIADWCIVDLLEQDGTLRRVAGAHRDPARGEAGALIRRYPPRVGAPHGPGHVVRTGLPEHVQTVDTGVLEAVAVDAEHLQLLQRLGIGSYLSVPLTARGRVLGALTLVTEAGRGLREDLRDLAEDLARRAATAIDNARLYEEAQAAIRARQRVLGIVSHDLRNPLGAIVMGAAAQIRAAGPEAEGRVIRKYADTIQRAAYRMSRLIDDLSDIASIEAGRLTLQPADEDPASIVRDVAESFQAAAAEAGTTLVCDVPGDLPAIVCDRERIVQALSNIMANAVKVTPGGTVTIRAEAEEREMVFSISDTGPGIAAADLPRIFDRYWRSTDAPYVGTGLGLSIAKAIVDAHRGRLWAESAPQRGSRFLVALPR